MPTLSEIGALLDLELRAGCDFPFWLDTQTYDVTGASAVMNIDYEDPLGSVHPLPLQVLPPNKLYCLIPASITTLMPAKSRHIVRLTEQDGHVRPLVYGTITCLREPE